MALVKSNPCELWNTECLQGSANNERHATLTSLEHSMQVVGIKQGLLVGNSANAIS